jgi:RNA polymerase sigma-70 factor (ECF subfamily)
MDVAPNSALAQTSFERVMLPHQDAVYNLARWLMRHEQDAEDCAQEAYVRAYQAFSRFRGGDGRAWILTIVRNVCYSRLRQAQHKDTPASFDEIEHGHQIEAAANNPPWQLAIARELLPQAMELLPVEAREILILHEIEGLAYREISGVMDIPIGTVMSRLARARLKLQIELKQLLQKDVSHGL